MDHPLCNILLHECALLCSTQLPLPPWLQVVSNEPGYYEDGGFGVRIENLVEVVEKNTPFR